MRTSSRSKASGSSEQGQSGAGMAQTGRPFGTVYYVSGEQYKGDWKDNKRHGQGVVTYKNGDKYGGEWQGGKRHGNGTLWVLQGGKYKVRYSGDWQHDLPEGSGVYFDDEGSSYEGEFMQGLRHGRGRAVTGPAAAAAAGEGGSGDVYEGCWQHDKRHGPGTLMLSNGDMYEGHWENDVKHGPGTFFYMAKGCRYDGIWHQGTARCGTYTEIQPAPPGAPGSIPNIELFSPEEVLHEAAAAAAGVSMASAAADAGAAAAAAAWGSSGGGGSGMSWSGQQHTACTVMAAAAGDEGMGSSLCGHCC